MVDISNLSQLFPELKQKYKIKHSSKYKAYEKKQKLRIKIFKEKVLREKVYKKLLKEISKSRIYSSTLDMFELILYIVGNLKEFNLIKESYPKFSYKYFLRNRDSGSILLNDIFTPYGFSFRKQKDKYKNYISFEELLEATYISDHEMQNGLIDKFSSHQNKLYLLLALSKNPSLSLKIVHRIKKELLSLEYTYPFSEDIHNIYSHIESNISKLSTTDNKDTPITNKKYETFTLFKFLENDEFKEIMIEELSNQIMYRKSESLISYFKALNEFLKHLSETIKYIKNKERYFLYLLNLLENDYRLIYYKRFYLEAFIQRVKCGDVFDKKDYEFHIFLEFMLIKKYSIDIYYKLEPNKSNAKDIEMHLISNNLYLKTNLENIDVFPKILDDHIKYFNTQEKVRKNLSDIKKTLVKFHGERNVNQ